MISSYARYAAAFLVGVVLAGICPVRLLADGAVPVQLVNRDGKWQLLRNGQPFFIKGAGGDGARQVLVDAGGNSFRTWGADNIQPQLDEAQKLGLAVTVGIWLGHERHGFKYDDLKQVTDQYERARKAILAYKDHPAVLMWAIGNEMEGYKEGDNAAIWSAINNIASMAKKLDPNHPTMTVTAEVGGQRVKAIHRLCPDIDICGINSYAGVVSIPERYRKAGGTKPYIVTEFGPPGVWEMGRNSYGAVAEPTSTEKAEFYRKGYQTLAADSGLCLGCYAFAWGFKQEATATWYGMFLPDGSKLAAVDAMTEVWSGQAPKNRCPKIAKLSLAGTDQVDPGATVTAKLDASDPDNDELKVKWVLSREAPNYNTGGDAEQAPPTYADAIVKSDNSSAEIRMPKDGGGYRLFAYVHDGKGGAAVANLPLRVSGAETPLKARTAKLPFVMVGDDIKPPYIPTGWMGDIKAIKIDEQCTDQPHSGKTCLKAEFAQGNGWGGVVWQDPAGDWGDLSGGYDLSGAKKLTFWARGAAGGEKVKFAFGILGKNRKYPDSAKGEIEVILTTEWKQYSIDLAGKDLSRIKTGFYWTLGGQGKGLVFYLDDVQYE